ncbi:MAG: hypothetical protein ACR2IE_13740 [Candidatus Sumerlaeaceae bacterium]
MKTANPRGLTNERNGSRFTTRPLSEEVHRRLAARNERVIGILGRVAEPEYHAYSNFQVRVLKSKTLDPVPSGLPDIFVVSSRAAANRDNVLRQAGYRGPFKIKVSKDDVLIYERPPHH